MFIDEKKEGTVHNEACLYGKWREAHGSKTGSLCSLFVHGDAPLLLKLQSSLSERTVKKALWTKLQNDIIYFRDSDLRYVLM